MNKVQRTYPQNLKFNDFEISYEEDLAAYEEELNNSQEFVITSIRLEE